MSAPTIRGIGNLSLLGNVVELPVDLPPRRIGDILIVTSSGFSAAGANAGTPETPGGAEVLHTNSGLGGFHVVYAIRIYDAEAALTLRRGVGMLVEVWEAVASVITNVTPATIWRDDFNYEGGIIVGGFNALTVSGPDRLAFGMFKATAFEADGTPGELEGPAGFDADYPEPADSLIGISYRYFFRTRPTDTSTAEEPYTLTEGNIDEIVGISFIGIGGTSLPALPQPGQFRLDCAKSYTTWITEDDYRTRVDVVGWSSIDWSRVLDESSNAKVTVPDIRGGLRCCIRHGGIEPWRFGLLIERNDVEVWKGPIVTIGRDPDAETTVLTASDFLKRYEKRFAVRNDVVEWVNTDTGLAFAGMINTHARSSSDAWFVEAPTVFTGSPITRHIAPAELTMAWDVLSELLGASVDAYVANGELYVWEPGEGWRYFDGFKRTLDGPYNANHDFVYGLFTSDAFTKLPAWDVNGMSMENFVAIPSADSGQYGFRQIWTAEDSESQLKYGVLDHMEPNTLNLPEDIAPSKAAAVLQARANTVRDLHSMPPVVVSGGVLAEGAPVNIANLRPGSIWLMDIFDACFGQLRVASRLKRIDVSVTLGADGPVESIKPTMFPPGFEGGEV